MTEVRCRRGEPIDRALRRLKKKRVEVFQQQLPEALDLISRALRAGQAFNLGMKLAAENFKDPLGKEFARTLGEINFGVGLADALKGLAGRVDCAELRFFVVAVILQRETGGNLAEIMDSISRIIRERQGFVEKVHAMTAEGRISARIIVGVVCGIVAMVSVLNPNHYALLLAHPTGRLMAVGSVALVVLGFVVMNRMSKLKV